jgi:hypothetical protein
MAGGIELEVPDFDQVRLDAGHTTSMALRLLWSVVNAEIASRQQESRQVKDTLRGKIISTAPGAAVNDFDTERATIVQFTGSSAQDVTGFRNGEDGRLFWLHNTGSGTYTIKHQNGGSVTTNRIVTQSGSDVSLTTGKTIGLLYTSDRWREMKDA